MNNSPTAPRKLLASRRFWSSIISIFTLLIAATRPELEEHLDLLAPTITTICVTLVGGYVIEDRERAKHPAPNTNEDSHDDQSN